MHHEGSERNHENDDGDLDNDDRRVRARAFADSVNQEHGHRRDNEERGEIHRDCMPGDDRKSSRRIIRKTVAAFSDDRRRRCIIIHQPERKLKVEKAPAKLHEITRPPDRYRHVADRVFENEIPPDDPCNDLAEGRIGIRVGGA